MANMQYDSIITNDLCKLAFQTSLPLEPLSDQLKNGYTRVLLLIHGFSGSSAYFKKNFDSLSKFALVIAVDLRGHGESDHTSGGYHVARLAMDLKELVSHIRICLENEDDQDKNYDKKIEIIPVGCSIGAAVLWTYVELFTDKDFAGMMFVDQAPLQNRSPFGNWDKDKAHRTCYDETTMRFAQTMLIERTEEAYKGLVQDCLGYRFEPREGDDRSEERWLADEKFFMGESKKCDPVWLAKLLADHTSHDHRETCDQIMVPVHIVTTDRSGCFTVEGVEETGRRTVKNTQISVSNASGGHWCFWEDPQQFNEICESFCREVCLARASCK